ncbi:Endonuclease/exonuclease/phosphatase [Catenaria anguillulae PL171]|uniref:Endonuclease/exonuclease/phosphatase n=1 Tax=Catenaria anguillulae PL171 TaxID=765915 RepID=A0A1Y2I3B0_9FUNG|nr:Endonuclease/exonuclease/phosphatase [Catenaria anguillulae PL171]
MDFSDTPLSACSSTDAESSAPLLSTNTQANASVASASSRAGLGVIGTDSASATNSRQSSPTRSSSQPSINPSSYSPTSLPKSSSVAGPALPPRPLPPLPKSSSPTSSTTTTAASPTSPAIAPGDIIALGLQEADTSTEVYLAHDPATLSTFRDQVTSALGPDYTILSARQLVGLVLIVAVHERIRPAIRNVEWASVGCGVMGVLGNKGGVAVRFWVYDSRVCIVNAHLAADYAQLARRNSDFHEIRRRLWFRKEDGGVGAVDEPGTLVFWIGDMNYRLQGTQERVVQIINENRLDSLLVTDQLKQAMAKGDAFAGFQEPPITFPPTYKYDIGTTVWDTSEKRRTPAWCDRILWHLPATSPEAVQPNRYMGHFGYLDSDHRPVSASLSVQVAVIDPIQLDDVTRDILREHDKWENELIPEANVLPAIVDLGALRLLHECAGECVLENTGKIPFVWEFVARPDHVPASGGPTGLAPWCTPEPQRGVVEPGDKQRIVFVGYPTPAHTALLNRSESPSLRISLF